MPDVLQETSTAAPVVTTEERYKFVTSQCVYCNEKIGQSFNLFLKLLSTLAGGVIWLRLQPNSTAIWTQISSLAVWLLVLLGFGTLLMIYRYMAAWWGFRRAESTLTGGAVPPPAFPRSCIVEMFLMLVVVFATFGGARFLLSLQ